jgi:hypothetical protein
VYFIVTSFESRIEQPTCHEVGIHKCQIVNNFTARNNRIPVVWLTNLATIDHGQNARVIDGKPLTHYSLRHLFDELAGGKLGAHISRVNGGSSSSGYFRLALFD